MRLRLKLWDSIRAVGRLLWINGSLVRRRRLGRGGRLVSPSRLVKVEFGEAWSAPHLVVSCGFTSVTRPFPEDTKFLTVLSVGRTSSRLLKLFTPSVPSEMAHGMDWVKAFMFASCQADMWNGKAFNMSRMLLKEIPVVSCSTRCCPFNRSSRILLRRRNDSAG